MYTTYVSNAQEGMLEALREVTNSGKTITVRGQETKEIQTFVMQIYHPDQRVICMPHRNNNIFAAIAETLWVLAGRNDIAFLSKYLPRAADFSDDGVVWRAGYGKRLRNFDIGNIGNDHVDQIKENIDLLNEDNTTRRAVMSIFDPADDFVRGTKDTPCSNWIHSMIRGNKLHSTIAVRSNDIMWGMSGINLFEWSVVMQLFAACTDTKIGEMNYLADSCHLYDRHYDRAQKIVSRYYGVEGFIPMYSMGFGSIPIVVKDLDDWDEQLSRLMDAIEDGELCTATMDNLIQDPFLTECGWMLRLYELIERMSAGIYTVYLTESICMCLDKMTHGGDFRVAALEYLHRQPYWDKISTLVVVDTKELEFLSQFNTSKPS
jgi:thymidylate synthase